MVTRVHLIPTARTHGERAKIKMVLNVFRTTVTPTNASPMIFNAVSDAFLRVLVWTKFDLHLDMNR